MVVATGYQLLHSIFPHHHHGVALVPEATPIIMHTHEWIVLGIGFIVSFIVALGVIAWFMHWVRKHGFVPFAIYRILLGASLFLGLCS